MATEYESLSVFQRSYPGPGIEVYSCSTYDHDVVNDAATRIWRGGIICIACENKIITEEVAVVARRVACVVSVLWASAALIVGPLLSRSLPYAVC